MRNTRVICAAAIGLSLLLTPTLGWSDEHEEAKSDEHEEVKQADAEPSEQVLQDAQQRRAWDQERMVDLTGALSGAMRELRGTFRREPALRDRSLPNQRAARLLEETLRSLERSCSRLASQVSGGAGFDETKGVARRIGMLLNDADVQSRRIQSTASMAQAVLPAMKLFNEIAPFYAVAPPFDLEKRQRVDRPANPDRPRQDP